MKKAIAIVVSSLIFLQIIPYIISGVSSMGLRVKNASAIGIIGSADGPTAVYVSGAVPPITIVRYALSVVCAMVFIVSSTVLLLSHRKT